MEVQTQGKSLEARRQELISRANEKGIDFESKIEDLPQDDEGLIVVALATLLELDSRDVLETNRTLEEIERDEELQQREQRLSDESALLEARRGAAG
jgi:hypothetical protein